MSKFLGAHAAVKDLNESGTNEEDILAKAHSLYKEAHPKKSSFAFVHVWRVLKSVPKWNDLRSRPDTPVHPKSLKLNQNDEIVEVELSEGSLSDRPKGSKLRKFKETYPLLIHRPQQPWHWLKKRKQMLLSCKGELLCAPQTSWEWISRLSGFFFWPTPKA